MKSPILETASRYLLSILLVFAVFLLLRGHNAPGGGFAGGLVAGAAFTLHAGAFDARRAQRALVLRPPSLLAGGLATMLAAALVPLLQGLAPMTGLWTTIPVPGSDPVHLGTPLLFDVGVFLTVLGTVTTITFAWEAQP